MKKYIVALILLLGGWQGLFGQSSPALGSFTTAAVAAGPSINLLNTGVLFHRLTWQTSGTVSTCTVALDTSADGVTWTPGGAIAGQTCTANGNSTVSNINSNYVRINVTTLSGGGSVIVTYNGWLTPQGYVAKTDLFNQSAEIGQTTLYAVPASAGGLYRMSCYLIVTQVATTSSTLPQCTAHWTDGDNNISGLGVFITSQNTSNTLTAHSALGAGAGVGTFNVRGGTNIIYNTTGYASVGATPMQFAIHLKLEYIGN